MYLAICFVNGLYMASVISTILNGKSTNAPLCHFVVLMSSWLYAKLNIVISASENYPHLGCLFYP